MPLPKSFQSRRAKDLAMLSDVKRRLLAKMEQLGMKPKPKPNVLLCRLHGVPWLECVTCSKPKA